MKPDDVPNEAFYPQDLRIIDDLETLKVVADPLRLRMLALLQRGPASAKTIAHALDLPIKKLYYHLALLEEHQLIHVHSTRVVSGIIEKQYIAGAYRITVARSLLSPAADDPPIPVGVEVFLSFVLDHARAEILKSIAAGLIQPNDGDPAAAGLNLGRMWLRLTPEQRDELARRTEELHMEFARRQADPADPRAGYYELLLGMYPTLAPLDTHKEPES